MELFHMPFEGMPCRPSSSSPLQTLGRMNRYNEHRRGDQYGLGTASSAPAPPLPPPPPPNANRSGHPTSTYVSLHSAGEEDTHYREGGGPA